MPKLPDGKVQMNFAISEKTALRFREACQEEGRKQNVQFERIIEEWLEKRVAYKDAPPLSVIRDKSPEESD